MVYTLLMTIRQRKYAELVVQTGRKRDSAIAAGYSPRCAAETAYKLNNHQSVQDYIDGMLEANMGARVQSATLVEIASNPDTPPSARIKAIDLLAKLSGHYNRLKVGESIAKDQYKALASRLIDRPAQVESRRNPPKHIAKQRTVTEYVNLCPVERDSEATVNADAECADSCTIEDASHGEAV
jgi:hypothetical protein